MWQIKALPLSARRGGSQFQWQHCVLRYLFLFCGLYCSTFSWWQGQSPPPPPPPTKGGGKIGFRRENEKTRHSHSCETNGDFSKRTLFEQRAPSNKILILLMENLSLHRDGILEHQFDKRLEPFSLCYCIHLPANFYGKLVYTLVLKIHTKSVKQENLSLFVKSVL